MDATAQSTAQNPYGSTGSANLFNLAGSGGSIPNYMGLAQSQQQINQQNAQQQNWMNNPNQVGPGGSRTMTQDANGQYTVNTSLSPQLQQNYDAQNSLNGDLTGKAQQLAGAPALNYGNAGANPTFNTSAVSGIPAVNTAAQKQAQDGAYAQQTQYLDPQFKQGQSDLEVKLANQGVMPGSEAYNREMLNFNNTKQQAYSNANMNAITAGNAEQTNLFNLGNQAHTTGMNDALAGYNTGMQTRQQGVSEANALHNAPLNDLASLRGQPQMTLPTYGNQVSTAIPGVDYLNAANMGYNANLGLNNANAASTANTNAGLYGLGGALIQSGALNGAGSAIGNWWDSLGSSAA